MDNKIDYLIKLLEYIIYVSKKPSEEKKDKDEPELNEDAERMFV